MVAMDAPIFHCEGIALFYRDSQHFVVEALHLHGQKIASFHLATRGCPLARYQMISCAVQDLHPGAHQDRHTQATPGRGSPYRQGL